MIIDREMLRRFNACQKQADLFEAAFPAGLDVSGLWGTNNERAATWLQLLSSEVVKHNLGWAISKGLIPARITADLYGADLSEADLRGADLRGADLCDADLRDADLRGADWRGLHIDGLPSGQVTLTPTPEGWDLTIGCWQHKTLADLAALIAGEITPPEARGPEIERRRPSWVAVLALCEAHAGMHPDVIEALAAKWGQAS